MKQNKFIKSIIILITGGLLAKALGFIIRIIYTRIIGSEGINLLMLCMPTYSLLVCIAQGGLGVAISKLVSEGKIRSKKLVLSIVPVMIIINIFVIVVLIFLSPYIANNLLHNMNTKNIIIAMSLVLPFISLSSLIRGYFFGKQKMMPNAISNIFEEIVKLILIVSLLPKLIKYGSEITIIGFVLLNIITEIISIIIFLIFLPRNIKIKVNDIKPDLYTIKEVFKISIPSLSSRLIGNIGYFFEPIILTNVLLSIGYSSTYITQEYGIFNAYSLPLLLIPSFFIIAISTALVPEMSKYYANNDFFMIKKRLKQSIGISLLIGIIVNLFVFIFAPSLLNIIYNTSLGVNYIRFLSLFFIVFYIEAPLISTLQSFGLSNKTMKITFYGVIIKLVTLATFSFLHIGIYGLLISEIINILFVVFCNIRVIKKVFMKKIFTK